MTSTMPFPSSPFALPILFARHDDDNLDFDDDLEDFDDSRYKPPRRRWCIVILTLLLIAGLWYVATNQEMRSSVTQVVTAMIGATFDRRAKDPAPPRNTNTPGPSTTYVVPAFYEGQRVAVILQNPHARFRLRREAEGEQRGPLVATGDILTVIDGSFIDKKWIYFVQTKSGDSGWIKERYLQAQS